MARDLSTTASRFATLNPSHVQSASLSHSLQSRLLIDVTATMSSSEEENFDINISDDESEEDYAPVVKKKTTATVGFSVSET